MIGTLLGKLLYILIDEFFIKKKRTTKSEICTNPRTKLPTPARSGWQDETHRDYFETASQIRELMKVGKINAAEDLLFDDFLNDLLPRFAESDIDQFGSCPAERINGLEEYFIYLILKGRHDRALVLFEKIHSQLRLDNWKKRMTHCVFVMQNLVDEIKEGENVIQSEFFKQYPEAMEAFYCALKMGLIRREKYKRSFKLSLS